MTWADEGAGDVVPDTYGEPDPTPIEHVIFAAWPWIMVGALIGLALIYLV